MMTKKKQVANKFKNLTKKLKYKKTNSNIRKKLKISTIKMMPPASIPVIRLPSYKRGNLSSKKSKINMSPIV